MSDDVKIDDAGFNDTELEDIMSEIESLEKDFGDVSVKDDSLEDLGNLEGLDDLENDDPRSEYVVTEEIIEEEPVMEEIIEEEPVMEEIIEEPVMEEIIEEPVMEEIIEEPVMEVESKEIDEAQLMDELHDHSEHTEDELKVSAKDIEKTGLQEEIENTVELLMDDEKDISEGEKMSEYQSENVVAFEKKEDLDSMQETHMDFSVSGQMNLKLNFKVNGTWVGLHVSEDEGFVIEMEGGAKFTLPVGVKKAS